MCRDAIIAELGGSPHELKLKEHLLQYCNPHSTALAVVSEIDVFLVTMGYINIVGYLSHSAPLEHIVIDFNDVVKPCLQVGV